MFDHTPSDTLLTEDLPTAIMATIIDTSNKVSLEDIDLAKFTAASKGSNDDSAGIPIRAMGFSTHKVQFDIDNQTTNYTFKANSSTFADWGSFAGNPGDVSLALPHMQH